MTRAHTVVVLGLGAILALGLGAILWLQDSGHHGDGGGPLGSYGVPGNEAMKVDPTLGPIAWTYGVPLCLDSGDEPARLEAVTPTTSIGSGFRVLGLGVREFTSTPKHNVIIATDSWPPSADEVPDPIAPVAGFAVSTPCLNGAFGPITELLVGLGLVSPDGGGWQGIEVNYRVGDRHHVLVLDHDLMICGQSVDCSVPAGS